jgi:hypothetical protein
MLSSVFPDLLFATTTGDWLSLAKLPQLSLTKLSQLSSDVTDEDPTSMGQKSDSLQLWIWKKFRLN